MRLRGPSGEPVVRLGMPLVDDYLEFLEGRSRPNTVLAAAYDLRVFFTEVAKPPAEVVPADVLGFVTAQRTGQSSERVLQSVEEPTGVATSTVARGSRPSRGSSPICRSAETSRRTRSPVVCRPGEAIASRAGSAADQTHPDVATDPDPGRGRRPDRSSADPPGPRDGRRDGDRRAAQVRGPRPADP